MTVIKYLKNGDISEQSIHKLLLDYIRKHPGLRKYADLILHIPNEGKRSLRYGALMKSLGMRKGVVDLFIASPKHGYGGAWVELKSKGGKLSPDQMQFLFDMQEQNFYTCVCWSLEEAIGELEWYFDSSLHSAQMLDS